MGGLKQPVRNENKRKSRTFSTEKKMEGDYEAGKRMRVTHLVLPQEKSNLGREENLKKRQVGVLRAGW